MEARFTECLARLLWVVHRRTTTVIQVFLHRKNHRELAEQLNSTSRNQETLTLLVITGSHWKLTKCYIQSHDVCIEAEMSEKWIRNTVPQGRGGREHSA